QFLFTNTTAVAQAVFITLSTTTTSIFPFSVLYLNSFNPANLALNYRGDSGSSANNGAPATYSVTIPAFTNFTVIVNEITAGAGVADYSLTVSGTGISSPNAVPEGGPGLLLVSALLGGIGLSARRFRASVV
ncbi:MAG: hypothetical protein M3Z32_04730, partial [Acidobacteriota bacterium]|nr:hypothetical protein [Acidobacteriota bacterium]